MKRIIQTLIVLPGLLLAATGCSIKEERSECPCWLDVFFEEFPEEGLVLSAWNGSRLFQDEIAGEDFSDFYEKEVKKGLVSLSAYRCKDSLTEKDGSLVIPIGSQADSLYAHLSWVECYGEFACDTVRLHKQFATVHLTLENSSGQAYPYWVEVVGNINGMNTRTLSPAEGEFDFIPELSENQDCSFRLPRQKDGSLSLLIYKKEDNSFVDCLALGELICASGYDWAAEDLSDIDITIDFAKVGIQISIRGWDSEYIYEITI